MMCIAPFMISLTIVISIAEGADFALILLLTDCCLQEIVEDLEVDPIKPVMHRGNWQ